jgi:hypothetical protein
MNPTSNSLREKAKNCRIMADSVVTLGTRAVMLDMAEDYERRAERLETKAARKGRA